MCVCVSVNVSVHIYSKIYAHIYIYICIYINDRWRYLPNCIYKSKLVTVVESDQKAPFSIATTPRCRGGRYSFSWIAPLYIWYIPNIAECLARRYQVPFLKSLVLRNLGLNPDLLDHWWTLYPLGQWAGYTANIRWEKTNLLDV